jgi:type I restriction enzyme S subunit
MKAWQGSYAVSEYNGIVSPAYYTCKLKGVNKDFFSKAIRSKVYVPFFTQYSKGIRVGQWDLNPNALKSIPFFLPTPDEQSVIVKYIDDKTSKIDAYVADKEKEIELLQELKQKTIADAVTKGLNPDAKMKDSGISWIGEIPEHWEVKRIASLFTGKVQANTDFRYHHAFKFYYGTLVPKNEVGDVEEYRDTYVKYSVLQKDDIMINGLNLNYDFVSQRVAIAPSDGIITSAYVVARPRKGTNAQYYNYLFKTMDNMKLFHGMGTGIRLTLSFDEMKKQVVVVPPQDEQQAIVAYIVEKCEKIDKLASELQSEIDYLKEYKQRLIADCVTGQVNVQNEMI